MADLSINFAGIKSPNPFWLASAPPANSGAQVHRAFEAGWGGAVWKTIGAPVLNVSNRYGAWHYGGQKMLAHQQRRADLGPAARSESARDRRSEARLAGSRRDRFGDGGVEARGLARHHPADRGHGADGIELNYGCPHGMSERGMGSAVGQVPEYCEQITRWVMEVAQHSGDREADAQHHQHRESGARRGGGGRERALADQHAQFDHRRRSGHARNHAQHRRQGRPRRLRGSGGEADRAEHAGGAGNGRSRCTSSGCRFPAWAEFPRGRTRRSFCCWARAACRSARR